MFTLPNINNRQYVELAIAPTDLEGNPVVLDADALNIEVVSGDGTARVNGNSLLFISGTLTGKTTYKVKADALPGEGVELIEEDVELNVVAEKAVALGLSVLKTGLKADLPTA